MERRRELERRLTRAPSGQFLVSHIPLYSFLRLATGTRRMIRRPAVAGGAGAEAANRRIRVLVVAAYPLVRRGIATVLQPEHDIEVVGEAGDRLEAVEKGAALAPDVVLFYLTVAGGVDIEAVRSIQARSPRARVLAVSDQHNLSHVRRLAQAGAVGYVSGELAGRLSGSLRALYRGAEVLVEDANSTRASNGRHSTGGTFGRRNGLSRAELEVLTSAAAGLTNKEIAAKLFLSESTVKTRLRRMYQRLSLHSRAHAVAFALANGLLSH